MIITLTGISQAVKHLGPINSYFIRNYTTGFDVVLSQSSVKKSGETAERITGSIAVKSGYTITEAIKIEMGGVDKTSNWLVSGQINIPVSEITSDISITGNATSNSGSGDSGGGNGGGTTPTNYTITYKYMCGSTEIQTATIETVTAGTTKTFNINNAPVISGYTANSVSPTSATINANTTVTYTYIEVPQAGTTWYIDNAEQTGKAFNYAQAFPGAAARIDSVTSAIRGVPINAVKFYPSAAGTMLFARWVPGNMPTLAASVEVPVEDVYASKPDDNAGAKTYMLSETITLAADELLLCKWNDPTTTKDIAGFWVNAGAGGDYAVSVWKTGDNTAGNETWGLPFSIGYIAE